MLGHRHADPGRRDGHRSALCWSALGLGGAGGRRGGLTPTLREGSAQCSCVGALRRSRLRSANLVCLAFDPEWPAVPRPRVSPVVARHARVTSPSRSHIGPNGAGSRCGRRVEVVRQAKSQKRRGGEDCATWPPVWTSLPNLGASGLQIHIHIGTHALPPPLPAALPNSPRPVQPCASLVASPQRGQARRTQAPSSRSSAQSCTPTAVHQPALERRPGVQLPAEGRGSPRAYPIFHRSASGCRGAFWGVLLMGAPDTVPRAALLCQR